VEGLEGLALQRGLDPAGLALASSCADVPTVQKPEHHHGSQGLSPQRAPLDLTSPRVYSANSWFGSILRK
jgi:hypothetical protein